MKKKILTKQERMEIYNKYGGHCAYCGKEIEYKDMQVDHIKPIFRGWSEEENKIGYQKVFWETIIWKI